MRLSGRADKFRCAGFDKREAQGRITKLQCCAEGSREFNSTRSSLDYNFIPSRFASRAYYALRIICRVCRNIMNFRALLAGYASAKSAKLAGVIELHRRSVNSMVVFSMSVIGLISALATVAATLLSSRSRL